MLPLQTPASFVKDASLANASIPAGLFAAACGPGSLEDTDSIYERLFFFIRENRLEIIGDACEERLIDEVGSSEKKDRLREFEFQSVVSHD